MTNTIWQEIKQRITEMERELTTLRLLLSQRKEVPPIPIVPRHRVQPTKPRIKIAEARSALNKMPPIFVNREYRNMLRGVKQAPISGDASAAWLRIFEKRKLIARLPSERVHDPLSWKILYDDRAKLS